MIKIPKNGTSPKERWYGVAQAVLMAEARAIAAAAGRLDQSLDRAVQKILDHLDKLAVSGIGKSGHIGQKIAATLASTGTPAVFLHAAELVNGDLGCRPLK